MRTIPLSDIAGATRERKACDNQDDNNNLPLSPSQKRKMMIDEQMEMDMAFEIGERSF